MAKINIDQLKKVFDSLKDVLSKEYDEYIRDATIQRFEYTYELCWKFLKRFLKKYYSIEEHNIKNLYRETGRVGLINEVEKWFAYHESRNLTAHTYNADIADKTYRAIKDFAKDAGLLIEKLSEINNSDK